MYAFFSSTEKQVFLEMLDRVHCYYEVQSTRGRTWVTLVDANATSFVFNEEGLLLSVEE